MHLNKCWVRSIICLVLIVCLAMGVMPGIAATNPSFTDITGHWAREAIDFMVEGGFMQGTSGTTFAPNLAFSRAMAVTILHRMAGEPEAASAPVFSDVATGRWYSNAVAWAHSSGVVQGIGGGRFAPNVNITRQEMATILHRFATDQGRDVTLSSGVAMDFPDANLIQEWAEGAMNWAVYNEIMRGTDLGTLNPQGNATRAEAATVLMRFAEKQPEQTEPEPELCDDGNCPCETEPEPEPCDDANCPCEQEPKPESPTADDFELTISVEETSLPQGENFRVHVELKNNSGQDLEIVYIFLFGVDIPGWNPCDCGCDDCPDDGECECPVSGELPEPLSRFFPANGVIRNIWREHELETWPIASNTLEPGTHELRFSARFHVNYGQNDLPHDRQIEFWSNTVVLTVQ